MNEKKLVRILTFIVMIVAFIIGFKSIQNEESIYDKTDKNTEVSEKEDSYILVRIENNNIITLIYDNGNVERSTNGNYDYVVIRVLSNTDIESIKSIIEELKIEEKKTNDFSNSYGMSIRLDSDEETMYSCELFSQDKVDRLNNLINSLLGE